jgi:hypothetical protein
MTIKMKRDNLDLEKSSSSKKDSLEQDYGDLRMDRIKKGDNFDMREIVFTLINSSILLQEEGFI